MWQQFSDYYFGIAARATWLILVASIELASLSDEGGIWLAKSLAVL